MSEIDESSAQRARRKRVQVACPTCGSAIFYNVGPFKSLHTNEWRWEVMFDGANCRCGHSLMVWQHLAAEAKAQVPEGE